ncbi:MAG: dihydrolipoamide acetyltransferase family protein [Acidobacteriota bacterium]|nr:dihydrolipoamide acetyltransferase family protein [Acidobacteriota bacterium]
MAYEFKLPDIGEGIVEGEIVKWLVQEGDHVDEDQPIVEILTDKATVEIPSPLHGIITERNGQDGEIIEVGATLVVIEEDPGQDKNQLKSSHSSTRATLPDRKKKSTRESVLATPAVRRLANELGIDLSQIESSNADGRLTEEDLMRYQESGDLDPRQTDKFSHGITETTPYRGIRKKIGDHLSLSQQTAVHFTYVEEVDATELVLLRQQFLSSKGNEDNRLTYLPLLIKTVVQGLKEHPLMNSSLDEENGVIQLKNYYNIGIATHTSDGLMVNVIRDVDKKGVLEISKEITELTQATITGNTKLENLQDGTFTITSLGTLGGIAATPIINYPEVAVLAVHRISERPVVRDGQVVIRHMMNLSITSDHRVVDGTVAAQFIHHIIPLIEDPSWLKSELGN